MDRVILHCDCNGYFASVECIDRPELKTVPMAVCGDPECRHGIILAKNELAKQYGIVTAETIYQAKRKCPELVMVPARHDRYKYYCEKINAIYAQYTDQVEAFSIDESWLDVTGSLSLFGSGKKIADTLRRRVREEIGITISVGVSYNKVFAKLGSDYKKPDATTVITRDNYKQLLYPLPVREMLFVGSSAAQLLNRQGITTIGELAECPKERLHALLGKMGDTLWTYANGLDQSEVRCIGESDPVKSISNDVTFARDLLGEEDIKTGIMLLSDSVGTRMRQQQVKALTVQVRIKTPELKIISRQETLHSPTDSTKEIYHTAMGIMRRSWDMRRPIRMLSVGCTNFADNDAPEQLCMFESAAAPNREKQRRLDEAVDAIRHKFGKGSIAFGQTMKTDIGGVGDKTEE